MRNTHNVMDIRQCRHFVEIVDQGSYSKAALSIPISQSALTRSIQKLESDLETKLLDRTTRGLSLTGAGNRFYARAKFILREFEQAKAEIKDSRDEPLSVSMGIAPLFTRNILPEALLKLQASRPDIDIQIKSALFPNLIKGISNGDFDFCFSNLPFSNLPDHISLEPLFDIDIIFIASRNHPLAKVKNMSFRTLSEYPWAVVDEHHSNTLYDYIFTEQGVGQSPVRIKTNSLSLLKSLVKKPPYITVLPHHMVRDEIERGEIVKLQLEDFNLTRKGGLIYRTERITHPGAEYLMEIFRELCA